MIGEVINQINLLKEIGYSTEESILIIIASELKEVNRNGIGNKE